MSKVINTTMEMIPVAKVPFMIAPLVLGGNGGFNLHSASARLTERFTRSGPTALLYSVTIDDPATWTRPWTIAFPWRLDPTYGFYEYACHEGNYAISNILSGARADDTAASAAR